MGKVIESRWHTNEKTGEKTFYEIRESKDLDGETFYTLYVFKEYMGDFDTEEEARNYFLGCFNK